MKKLLLAFIFLFTPFIIINFLFIKAEYSTGTSDIRKFYEVPNKIQLANLGSSLGKYSFDFSQYPEITAFNFSMPQQYLELDKSILLQYLQCMDSDSIMLIIVGMINCDSIPSKTCVEDVEKKYYQFLEKKLIPQSTLFKYVLFKIFPSIKARHPFRVIKNYYFTKSVSNENIVLRFSDKSPQDQYETAKYASIKCFEPFPRKGEIGLNYNKKLIDDLIAICKDNKIKPVIVTPPLTKVFYDFLVKEDGFTDAWTELKERIHNSNTEVLWLDYSYNSSFSDKADLFQDPFHLNSEGALLFSDEIISDLKKAKLLSDRIK